MVGGKNIKIEQVELCDFGTWLSQNVHTTTRINYYGDYITNWDNLKQV